ncbi:MAG: hypothetical protein VX265_17465, partial [Myxococcota bacterium]|nr:hypothetical protein [Myxococcota bacterium]
PCRRVALPSFEKTVLPTLGDRVLVRFARRDASAVAADRAARADAIARLPGRARRVLTSAQRHALDGMVVGLHAWDPLADADAVRALHGAGLLQPIHGDPPITGRYRVDPDLPDPPRVEYDFSEAVMPETDDLAAGTAGPARMLEDAAALAAAIDRDPPRRTHNDTLSKTDVKRLARRLGAPDLPGIGLERHPRWGLALRALEALGAVSMDPMERRLYLDLGLDRTLSGETSAAVNRFVHRVLDRDLHPAIPAIREALRQAGNQALDQMILSEELREQHRDVLFPRWHRQGLDLYPSLPGETPRMYDDDGWDAVEDKALDRALRRLSKIGLVRRAEGVVAATEDGRAWAEAFDTPRPPIWVSGDLEVIIPPGALTPGERFQLERLSRCLSRDVTDRLRIEQDGLRRWLSTHDLDEVLEMLSRRAPGLPAGVVDTLQAWDRSARRVVLTHGVLVDPEQLQGV